MQPGIWCHHVGKKTLCSSRSWVRIHFARTARDISSQLCSIVRLTNTRIPDNIQPNTGAVGIHDQIKKYRYELTELAAAPVHLEAPVPPLLPNALPHSAAAWVTTLECALWRGSPHRQEFTISSSCCVRDDQSTLTAIVFYPAAKVWRASSMPDEYQNIGL